MNDRDQELAAALEPALIERTGPAVDAISRHQRTVEAAIRAAQS